MQVSFRDKFVADKPVLYEVFTTPSDGRNAYYYVLVYPDRCNEFEHKMKINGSMKLNQYGIVIASGFGAPNEALKAQLILKYNVKPAS